MAGSEAARSSVKAVQASKTAGSEAFKVVKASKMAGSEAAGTGIKASKMAGSEAVGTSVKASKMAARGLRTTTRLELEIEKHREESNWKKLLELTDQLKTRLSSGLDILIVFVLGESKLEQYLEANPPNEQNIAKAKTNLLDARRHLMNVVTEPIREKPSLHQNLVQDSWFLMGKLCYATGAYEEALNCFHKGGLEAVSDRNLANRGLKIVAEAYAIKGLCMEKLPPTSTSKYKIAEREEQIVRCFETATDMALLYLQEHDKQQGQTMSTTSNIVATVSGSASPLPGVNETQLGPILETAVQRAPIMHIKKGDLNRAVTQYRNVLTAVEASGTQNLRTTLARQLAEVLIRGVSERAYIKPEPPPSVESTGSAGSKFGAHLFNLTDSPLKPRRYTGQNLFVPKDENEEVLLLLLICEAMAVRDAVLSRSPDHKEARVHSYNNTTAIYDLLVISLVRRSQFNLLCESFEKSMKFSFEAFHIWFQFALSLIAASKHNRAILVLRECMRLEPSNSLPCLLAAKVCLENINQLDDGISYALQALEREKTQSQGLTGRCLIAAGVGYMLKAEQNPLKRERQDLLRKAFESFHKALQNDPNDFLGEFYLALHFAQARQIPEAIQHVKIALSLRSEHVSSLHLLMLLLSAQKQYDEALRLVEATLEEFPDNLNLMYTKAHLEEQCLGGEVALLTTKQMLQLWKTKYEEQTTGECTPPETSVPADVRSIFQLYTSEVSDRDSSSLHAQSIAASRVEQALSEVASSFGSLHPRRGPQQVWVLQLEIWLLLARLYLKMNQLTEANACIQEAAVINPLSHKVMYMKGLVSEHKREFHEARICFQNAIAVNPVHVKSLQHLGMVYHYSGSSSLAEKTLRDAVKIDPMSHKSWYNMGRVLQAIGECDVASDCIATAIDLEATSPILPFTVIPRSLD